MEKQRLVLSFLTVGIIIFILFSSKPAITGYVPSKAYTHNLDIEITKSQRFAIPLSSVMFSSIAISGSVQGNGLVNVYLSGENSKWLVFTNKKKTMSGMSSVTGRATRSVSVEPVGDIDLIETFSDEYTLWSGDFTNSCAETCSMKKTVRNENVFLDVIIDPGTVLKLNEITFTGDK